MLDKINENITLKEIMELDKRLFEEVSKLGFDICCAKMKTLKDSCIDKGLDVEKVLNRLNKKVEEINYIEKIIFESE
jgi:iron-sulfur cluster repair protein YtfE (RIC family)